MIGAARVHCHPVPIFSNTAPATKKRELTRTTTMTQKKQSPVQPWNRNGAKGRVSTQEEAHYTLP